MVKVLIKYMDILIVEKERTHKIKGADPERRKTTL